MIKYIIIPVFLCFFGFTSFSQIELKNSYSLNLKYGYIPSGYSFGGGMQYYYTNNLSLQGNYSFLQKTNLDLIHNQHFFEIGTQYEYKIRNTGFILHALGGGLLGFQNFENVVFDESESFLNGFYLGAESEYYFFNGLSFFINFKEYFIYGNTFKRFESQLFLGFRYYI